MGHSSLVEFFFSQILFLFLFLCGSLFLPSQPSIPPITAAIIDTARLAPPQLIVNAIENAHHFPAKGKQATRAQAYHAMSRIDHGSPSFE